MNHTLHIQIVSFGLVVATRNETKNTDFGVDFEMHPEQS